jgi:HD-GYP domain-containing protein (c-di-GMP phosphodiesterase class II)
VFGRAEEDAEMNAEFNRPADRPKSASFEEDFNRKALSQGRVLVNQLAILVKVAQMHDLKNEAVENAAEVLRGTISSFFDDRKSVSLNLIGEYLFLEDIRIKYNIEDFNNFDFLVSEFRKRKIGSLSFNALLDSGQLIQFVSIFSTVKADSDEVYQDIARRLGKSGISGISTDELKPPKAADDFEKIIDAAKAATKAYIRVVLRVKELYEGISAGQPADIRKLKRSVQSLVDSAYKSEKTLLKLSAIRRREDLLPRHYANVCVLSLLIGKRVGLSKYHMARLGMAALLHDIGRSSLPEGFEGEPDEESLKALYEHPRLGVQTILRLKGLNEVAVSAMIVSYEHHRNLDGTGYPPAVETKDICFYSRIVRIADNYDAATSSGIYGNVAVPPDRVLKLMSGRAGSYYDSELLGKFISAMGAYPVGTFVMLKDGRFAVVAAPGGREGLLRPHAVVVGSGDDGEAIDLSLKDDAGEYRQSIATALDPERYRVNIYKYLF